MIPFIRISDNDNLTKDQVSSINHALGLNYKKKPNRNYFYTSNGDKNWNDLADKGYAIKSNGWNDDDAYFRLTYEFAKMFYKEMYGRPMSLKYFKKL